MLALHNNRLPKIFIARSPNYMELVHDHNIRQSTKNVYFKSQLIKISAKRLYYTEEGVYGEK